MPSMALALAGLRKSTGLSVPARPWRFEVSIPAAYTRGNRSHDPLFVFFVQDFRHEGLICFNLQPIVPQCFFVEQFLSESSDFMFQRFLRSKLKHGI
jgi:hypothetical protein